MKLLSLLKEEKYISGISGSLNSVVVWYVFIRKSPLGNLSWQSPTCWNTHSPESIWMKVRQNKIPKYFSIFLKCFVSAFKNELNWWVLVKKIWIYIVQSSLILLLKLLQENNVEWKIRLSEKNLFLTENCGNRWSVGWTFIIMKKGIKLSLTLIKIGTYYY